MGSSSGSRRKTRPRGTVDLAVADEEHARDDGLDQGRGSSCAGVIRAAILGLLRSSSSPERRW